MRFSIGGVGGSVSAADSAIGCRRPRTSLRSLGGLMIVRPERLNAIVRPEPQFVKWKWATSASSRSAA
jgi:hypothetical protein